MDANLSADIQAAARGWIYANKQRDQHNGKADPLQIFCEDQEGIFQVEYFFLHCLDLWIEFWDTDVETLYHLKLLDLRACVRVCVRVLESFCRCNYEDLRE